MYHDENSPSGSPTYPLVGVPIDYPYGLTPAPLMDSAPAINPASNVCWNFDQAQNWTTTPASPTVTLPPLPILRCREIRPRPLHESASTLPPVQPGEAEQHSQHQKLGRRKHSKGHRQLDQGYLKKTARSAIRTVSEVTRTTKKQERVGGMSRAKPPKVARGDSATQGPRPWSPGCSSNHPEDSSQASVRALQRALRAQVLQSLEVLREIAKEFRAFNLGLETIDVWVAEIKEVDETLIPVPPSTVVQVYVPFEKLNFILTKCIIASGPTRDCIVRDQALELLKYIQTYGEEYHLFRNLRVHLDIGRYIERLNYGKDNEMGK
ncbi:unnamed protein product [Penicillium nalgiovense]|uniref:Uncharacterized protein n=1 Tax=Penicillium nalgiovense TaxID=60175 RepID=A0A9W4I4W5_PENNA|nr:unnamed protein product [Penicillium nalgiovense]CAG8052135.1 unnamed protein product [Penicillium nalgiovense]CAG8062704.1 unnamed protein product [Penicillium nalgiovense]CAG8100931.1 unnamed protein product [Penicillium nalgiovense]CAG8104079.1 unnamed protein product [Penicillium nalgiovense]